MSSILEIGYVDVILLAILLYVIYIFFFKSAPAGPPPEPPVPALPMSDMTVEQLKKYNGVDDEHILLAVSGRIYDVTKGKSFYGPGSAYENLAGHDATRAFALFDVKQVKEEYDDISDLKQDDINEADEWKMRLAVKYPYIGKLLKPGEEPSDYNGELAKINYSA